MDARSLRLRLAVIAALSILVVVAVVGYGLLQLFERHVNRRVEGELDTHLRQIAAELSFDAAGKPMLSREPADPRYEQPFSGLYWQIEDASSGAMLRSRSLWDHVLELPRTGNDRRQTHRYLLPGPLAGSVIVAERHVNYPDAGEAHSVRIAVGLDRREVVQARGAFAEDMAQALVMLALILFLASWAQIAIGLRPLEALRRAVNAVRAGTARRVDVTEPAEVMPLVGEVNALLEAQAKTIERARASAGDLAHVLKTPLMVLTGDAERLRQKGEVEIAAEIDDLAAGMRRHIGRELNRARLQSVDRQRQPGIGVASVVDGVVRTLVRSPAGSRLAWMIEVPESAIAEIPAGDFAELVGNLLDNAAKWAKASVRVIAGPGLLALTIEDDGPGVTPGQLERLGRRGIRLDESVEGSGLGLAIARDIAEAYGCDLTFSNCTPRGFRVALRQRPPASEPGRQIAEGAASVRSPGREQVR